MRETLKSIGLKDEEINIYITLLKLGQSKATTLSKELKLARTTIYRFLEILQNKGLISESIENNVKHYSPVEPKRIPEILKEKVCQMENIIPELESIKKTSSDRTKIELFKGYDGIKTVMKDIIRTGENYTFIGEAEKYFEKLSIDIFSSQWIKQVEKEKIKGRLLCPINQKFKVAKTEEYKILSKEIVPEISMWTYGNKTAQFVWSEPFYVILIEDKSVTKSNQKIFEYLWETAKLPSKKHLQETKPKY